MTSAEVVPAEVPPAPAPVALVTGAGGGIGRACAYALSSHGFRVVVNDRNSATAGQVVEQMRAAGASARAAVFDVAEERSWASAIGDIAADWGPVKVLVNNAALKASTEPGDGDLLSMDLNAWQRILRVNLGGPMLGARAVLPGMLARRGGSIIMISSISAVRSVPGLATAYTAAKAGLDGLTRSIATTFGPSGVRCNSVAPGIVLADGAAGAAATSLSEQGLIARDGTATDIGSVVAFLAGEQSRFVNGQTLIVDGGISNNLAGVGGRFAP